MPRSPRKRWTVLIYMVADDPQGGELLDQQAVREMDQITKAALSVAGKEHLHVALQIDFRTLPGVWRRVIGESTFVRPEGNAADPATLYGFFDWAVTECPAEHYLLIFWGHSRGQFGLFGDPDPFDYTAQTLTLEELREALKAAKRTLGKAVDVIAFKDCYMATLEAAYELKGLADYLIASPGLVPVERWPYDQMFKALTDRDEGALEKAKQILDALRKHYDDDEKNRHPFDEVPYSLLSTLGAGAVVEVLGELVGSGSKQGVGLVEKALRPMLDDAAEKSGDSALVDLGALVPVAEAQRNEFVASLLDQAAPDNRRAAATNYFNEFAQALGNSSPALNDNQAAAAPEQLVITHTGTTYGGVSVFVYPKSAKAQRDSRLTRLADERVYRRLAISTDTNWADIALQEMPPELARPAQDVSAAIALLEQLQRLGVGMTLGSVELADAYRRRLAQYSRTGALSDADVAQAAEYAAIAELASRLAAFASKGTGGFGPKGTGGFGPKGTGGFGPKGTGGFGPKGTGGFAG